MMPILSMNAGKTRRIGMERGFAQIVVLWALLLLGTLALSFSFAMRTEALAARNGLDGTRAYYLARTGINRVLALLSTGAIDNVLAEPLAGEEEDASYRTIVISEGGKIDINFATEDVLKGILRKGGLSPEEAEAAGDSILDWRDQDDMPRANGAESPYYSSIPAAVKPRNGKFATLDELLSVKGVTPDFFTRFLSRVFTVHGGSPSVDVNFAPGQVLLALPGFTSELAEAVVSHRKTNPFRSPAEVAAFLSGENMPGGTLSILSSFRSSRVYTVRSIGKAGERIERRIECMVEIRGAGPKSVKILRWADYVPGLEEGEKL